MDISAQSPAAIAEKEPVQMSDVQRLEAERLRPMMPEPGIDELFHRLLNLIAAECRRAGYLPRR